ncbi:MAG TPA: hypothetical protein VFL59_16410, partial [Candidatus Nanopelagicales bacterium]|nr:hypothetical protein [Candidatus Nanopelagicales bacterium]
MQSASALTERDPTVLGPYLLLGRVADGGMGVVYLGRHDGRADSLVAVKTLKPQTPAEPLFRSRLRHEIRAARALSGIG